MNIALDCALPPCIAHAGDDWRQRCQGYGSFYLYAEDEKNYLEPALFLRDRCPGCTVYLTVSAPPFAARTEGLVMEPIAFEGDETLAELTDIEPSTAPGYSLRAIARRAKCGAPPKETFAPYLKQYLTSGQAEPANPMFDQWILQKVEELLKQKFERIAAVERDMAVLQGKIDNPDGVLAAEDAIASFNSMVAEIGLLDSRKTALCHLDRYALLREALGDYLL